MILDFQFHNKHDLVLCQSECAYLHKKSKHGSSTIIKIPTHKGEHSRKCTYIVLQTKSGNWYSNVLCPSVRLPVRTKTYVSTVRHI